MSVRIGVGLAGLPFADARGFWRMVERCEDSRVDSIWQSDRLVSADPQLECMTTMAALAGATSRLKFGMNVAVISFRDPLVLAKECATIDYLSGGRFLPAFGVGPELSPEWKAAGYAKQDRGRRSDEALEIMSRLWQGERVDFDGAHYHYRGAQISPTPVQKPLPLWIGGSSAAAVRRTARYGTGWVAGIQTAAQVAPVVAAIRKASAEAGRPIDPDHYGAGLFYHFGSWDHPRVDGLTRGFLRFQPDLDPRAFFAIGGAAEICARIAEYRAAGISKFVLRPIAEDESEFMDQLERLIGEIIPAVHD
jgi:probable F420-dependent oxidoreductase